MTCSSFAFDLSNFVERLSYRFRYSVWSRATVAFSLMAACTISEISCVSSSSSSCSFSNAVVSRTVAIISSASAMTLSLQESSWFAAERNAILISFS